MPCNLRLYTSKPGDRRGSGPLPRFRSSNVSLESVMQAAKSAPRRSYLLGLTVSLSHARNPDIDGGYWDAPVDPGKRVRVPVISLKGAQKVVRNYIERNNLGGGNWTGGELMYDGVPVGRISYNGRAWDLEGAEMACTSKVLA